MTNDEWVNYRRSEKIKDLEQENKLLREALDWCTSNASACGGDLARWIEKHEEYRKTFNLDGEA